jgi:hypothetical protein
VADGFPCPACGFLTFSEPPGSYEICEICGWEDDHVQLAHPRMQGGANRESLVEAQREAIDRFPLDRQSIDRHRRDPEWRPLTSEEAAVSENAPRSATDYFHAATAEEPTYYWRKPHPSR